MGILSVLLAATAAAAEPVVRPASNTDPGGKVGQRPYEMAWADRKPDYPETVDFESLEGWMAAGFLGCTADLFRSREEQMFGTYVGKALYTGKTGASYFELRPPSPIPIPGEPTAVQLWVRGNNWGWEAPKTARTSVSLIVRDAKGEHFAISLGHVDFDYWFLLHAAFVSPMGHLTGRIHAVGAGLVPAPVSGAPTRGAPTGNPSKEGAGDGKIDYPLSFVALRVTGCSDERPARLFFDSLQFYKADYQRPLPELKLPPREAPWPTTPDTMTPTPREPVAVSQAQEAPPWTFLSKGGSDTIRWTYSPKTGTLDDLSVEINGKRFQPCSNGGPVLLLGGKEYGPGEEGVRRKLIGIDKALKIVVWSAEAGGEATLYTYQFRAKDKSLQVSATVEEPRATAFRIGHTAGTPGAELISVPYLTFGNLGPHVVSYDGVFLSGLLDWYNSDASVFFEEHGRSKPDEAVYNGGSRYLPKTDGKRNPLRERLILTVSTDFAEALPNLPHPKNPMAHPATGSIWRNIGDPQPDLLKRLKAHGVERFICPLHETGWRDAGESFTFRLRCAPRIGDEKMIEYGKLVHSLGYRFGLYANYTDYAPVNGNWREDRVCMDSDGNWRGAWPRCYAPRPTWAWQAEADLAPKIAAKFGAVTCYSDVHTAIRPWDRTDYDARSPGAGMFRTVWDCYARILWTECQAYSGPVFSEGGMQWMYAGLISGNYGQMTGPERWKQPPLVDFDLLKLHPLQTDFGMGSPDMFYSGPEWHRDRSRTSLYFDRFITSTLAFGHIGFLALEWGFDGALKSFYLTNAVQQLYALQPPEEIRYFDGSMLVNTSKAIRTGGYRRGQVYVRYAGGLQLWCNLSFDQTWTVACDGKTYVLPPTGHLAFKKGDVLQFSAVMDGRRMDYVDSPEYFYLDTRDRFVAVGPLACRGALALKPVSPGYPPAGAEARGREAGSLPRVSTPREAKEWWAIPCDKCEDLTIRPSHLGLGRDAALAAAAFDLDDKPLGEAEVRVSNLGHTILAVRGAVRYRIIASGTTAAPDPDEQVRRLVAGLDYTLTAAIANFSKEPLRDATVTILLAERSGRLAAAKSGSPSLSEAAGARHASPGATQCVAPTSVGLILPSAAQPGSLPVGEGNVAEVAPGREAQTTLRIHIPADVVPGERLWYRVRVVGRTGDRAAEGVSWFTGLAARAFDVEIRPAGPAGLAVSLKSHLPGTTAVTVKAESPTLALTPKSLDLTVPQDAQASLALSFAPPSEPCVAPFELTVESPHGKLATARWLRFVRSKVAMADLAKVPPAFLGMELRGKPEEPLKAESGGVFRATANTVGGLEKPGFFCHPPYQGGVGSAFGEFEAKLPDEPCAFETFLGFQDGSTTEDGCVFSLEVKNPAAYPPEGVKPSGGGAAEGAFPPEGYSRIAPSGGYRAVWKTQYAELKKWKLFRADLSKFRGQKVTLRLVTDVGPADNSHSDWACWGEPRIVLASDRLVPEVFDKEPIAPIGPPPIPLKGLKAADLREIAEAKVMLDGAGVDGGEYQSDVYLNDVFVGHTPGSASDTVWSEKQALTVPPEAMKTIGPHNIVLIRNPRQDHMKVRRVHLWFRLRDGRVGASSVANGPFSTPAEWPHAEGDTVPLGADLPAMECDVPADAPRR